jgi:hypothetical protein
MVRGTPFQEGNPGRPKGIPNKITKSVKETVLKVFNELQLDDEHNLESFAKKYPRDFYGIAAKLIPTEIKGDLTAALQIVWKEEKTYEAEHKADTSN